MRFLATAALTGLLLAGPASAQTLSSRVHNTGTAALRVFNNGYFGADAGLPTDTTFRVGTFGGTLYEGQLIIAVSPSQISGSPYSGSIQAPTPGFDWTFGPRPATITPPPPFTQAFETSYTDGGTNNTDPAGLTVRQRSFARTGDDFVTIEFAVSSVVARTGVYIGLFGDFDISTNGATDKGGFDQPTRTAYAFNGATGTTGNRNYYGVTLIGRNQSGWSVTTFPAPAPNPPADPTVQIYSALTTNGTNQSGTINQDRRLLVGAGPYTLAANVPQTVRFAYVTGTSLADLLANAAVAQSLAPVAGEGTPAEAEGLALLPAVPNPASSATDLAFTLDAAQDVRLAVYDVLGRQVALVAEGARAAGTHTATLDASRLPSGVYVARLTAGGQTVLRRFTVVR